MIINNYWTIIITLSIIVAILFILGRDDAKGISDMVLNICISESIILIASLVICGVLRCLTDYSETEIYSEKYELVAVNDYIDTKEKLNGYFFLCVGGISEEKKNTYNVTYAYKDSNGIIRPENNSINTQNKKIGFKEDGENQLEIFYEKEVHKLNKLGEFLFKNPKEDGDGHSVDYVFHVPQNSIIKNIDVDLK